MVGPEALAGLSGIALFGAPGAGIAELLPAVRSLPRPWRLALAYLLGIAWTASSLYALSKWLGVPLRPPAILTVAAAPLLAGGLARIVCRNDRHHAAPRPRALSVRLALAAGALVSASVLCDALTRPLTDWDGRVIWATQARYVRSEGSVDPRVIVDRGWFVAHPWYPLFMPVAQAAALEITGASVDHPAFRPMYAAFLPAWLLSIYAAAAGIAGGEAAGWATLCAALLSFPAFAGSGGATSAYSDLPLACFYGSGLALLLRPKLPPSAGIAAGMLLAAAVLTKTEGAALVFSVLAIGAGMPVLRWHTPARRRRSFRLRLPALALASVAAISAGVLLLSWWRGVADPFGSYEHVVSWSLPWPGIVTRAPRLAWDAAIEMTTFTNWGFFWPALVLVLVAGRSGVRRRPVRAWTAAALIPIAIGWLYATISLEPDLIVRTTWNRFLLQASIPIFVVFAAALRDVLRPRLVSIDGRSDAAYLRTMQTSSIRARLTSLLSALVLLVLSLPLTASAYVDDSARNQPGDFVINRPAGLYSRPAADSRILRELRPRTVVNVIEVLPQWYKVQSTKGLETGFVRRSYADPRGLRSDSGDSRRGSSSAGGERRRFRVGTFRLSDPAIVRDSPSMSGRRVAQLREGAQVRVVDKDPSGLWYKIESETGNKPPGWIPTQSAKRVPTN